MLTSQYSCAPVAQLDRASGYEPEGREFESPRAHHFLQEKPDITGRAFSADELGLYHDWTSCQLRSGEILADTYS